MMLIQCAESREEGSERKRKRQCRSEDETSGKKEGHEVTDNVGNFTFPTSQHHFALTNSV
jgi:hypothetical protein